MMCVNCEYICLSGWVAAKVDIFPTWENRVELLSEFA